MFACLGDLIVSRIQQLECIDLDDRLKVWHLGLGQAFPYDIIHKEYLCF